MAARVKQGTNLAREARLTKAELESWESFTASAWAPFRDAWIGRGFHYAPSGSPNGDDTSQRGLLWQIADARPTDLARWVSEASGKTPREVIDYVLERWHEVRAEVGVDEDIDPRADAALDRAALVRIGFMR